MKPEENELDGFKIGSQYSEIPRTQNAFQKHFKVLILLLSIWAYKSVEMVIDWPRTAVAVDNSTIWNYAVLKVVWPCTDI